MAEPLWQPVQVPSEGALVLPAGAVDWLVKVRVLIPIKADKKIMRSDLLRDICFILFIKA
jgi:hypothetical protein